MAKVDRHKSRFMVRLPEIYRTQLRKLQRQSRKTTMSGEICAALEAYLGDHGLWPPQTRSEPKK